MTRIYSLSDLKFISPVTLRAWLRGGAPGKFAIVDVRESDYIGGHIKGSLHYSAGSLNETLPDLKRKLREKDVDNVIFHCALSQVRGPRSALTFLRSIGENELADPFYQKLQVSVLKGGFTKWQELYGEDPEATEDFDKEIWSF